MSVLRTLAGTMATKGAGMVLTFAVGVLISRSLGPAGKGDVDVLLNALALLLLAYPSLEEPQLYLLAQKEKPKGHFLGNAILASVLFGLAVFGLCEVVLRFFPDLLAHRDRVTGEQRPVDAGLLRALALVAGFEVAHRLFGGLLQGVRAMRAFNAAHLAQNLTLFTLAAVFLLWLSPGTKGAVTAHMGAMVVGGVAAMVAASRHEAFAGGIFRPDIKELLRLIRRGLRIHGGVVAAYVILMSDILVIHHFRGGAEVGLYALAVALTGHLRRLVLQPVKEVLGSRLPAMVADREKTLLTIAKTSRHVVLLTLVPGILLLVVGWPFLYVVYGASFVDSFWPLVILLPGNLLWSVAVLLSYWFIGRDRLLALTAVGTVVALTNLLLNFVFVPRFGMIGAAATSTASYALHLTIFGVMVRSEMRFPIRRFLVPERQDFQVYRDVMSKLLARVRPPK